MAGILALPLGLATIARGAVDRPSANPTHFSPNGNSVRDTTAIKWVLTDVAPALFLRVRQTGIGTLDTLLIVPFGARPAGPDSFVWDGRDSTGVIARDSSYFVDIFQTRATDDTIRSIRTVTVTLDTTPPRMPVFSSPPPAGLETTDSVLPLTGNAPGADSLSIFWNGVLHRTIHVASSFTDTLFAFDAGTVDLVEGTNDFYALSHDQALNRSPVTPIITVTYRNTSDLVLGTVSPLNFSPNADAVQDSTEVGVTLDAATSRLEVQVRRAKNATQAEDSAFVRLYDAPAATGEYTFAWDGLDSTGVIAPDGAYYFVARAESSGTGGVPLVGTPHQSQRFNLDTTAPSVPVVNPPLPASTDRNSIEIVASATGATNILLFRSGTELPPRSVSPMRRTIALDPGSNSFTLQGLDAAGNLSAVAGPIVVVRAEQPGFHASERFGPGDVFSVNLSTAPRSVVIEVRTLGGRLVRTLTSSSTLTDQEIAWNLRDDDGNSVGDGPYVARMIVTYPDGRTDEAKGAVVVVK
ncbi:MAG: FlgD immunoglobulin-like domain containing protein [Candidatus Eiseniibacteriota bacterium]